MFLILDTNILFSFFWKSKVFRLVRKLRQIGYELTAPDFVFSELSALKEKILKASKLSESEYEVLLIFLKYIVKEVSEDEYKEYLSKAESISPHPKVVPLFELSLALDKTPIWSREPRLKRQRFIKVLNDEEVEQLTK